MCPWIFSSCLLLLGSLRPHRPPSQTLSSLPTGRWNQPCGSSEGSLTRSLCAHTGAALCAQQPAVAFDKATQGSLFQAAGIIGRACTGPQQSCDRRLLPPCSNPLQKHNLNNSFHIKLWSDQGLWSSWLLRCGFSSPVLNGLLWLTLNLAINQQKFIEHLLLFISFQQTLKKKKKTHSLVTSYNQSYK